MPKTQKVEKPYISAFNFQPGRVVAKKYQVIRRIGKGYESEVYLLRELQTKIEKTGKFFYPDQNINNRALVRYAKKLHKLRHCPALIQYYTQDTIRFQKQDITFLVSEYVQGKILKDFLQDQPGKKLHAFQALHLLHSLASGMTPIHHDREYHGDLHHSNIIVHRSGLGFELKILDFYHWANSTRPENIQEDVYDMIKIFYDALGGAKHYSKQPQAVKEICCGLKRTLIRKKFKKAGHLKRAIENLQWD